MKKNLWQIMEFKMVARLRPTSYGLEIEVAKKYINQR